MSNGLVGGWLSKRAGRWVAEQETVNLIKHEINIYSNTDTMNHRPAMLGNVSTLMPYT
jgi:hypothetical protein